MPEPLKNQPWFNSEKLIYPDFPVKGVNFLDIFALLRIKEVDAKIKRALRREFFDFVVVPESRGFLYASELGLTSLLPLRKKNKLPGDLVCIPFTKEYGQDEFYYQKSALENLVEISDPTTDKEGNLCLEVTFFDDVLATGGTAKAVVEHFNSLNVNGVKVVLNRCFFIVELDSLDGRKVLEDLGVEVCSVFTL